MNFSLSRASRFFVGASLTLSLPIIVFAQSNLSGQGTIKILQENRSETTSVLGSWTLIKPDNEKVAYEKRASYEYQKANAGKYTVLFTSPEGMTANVELYSNGNLVSSLQKPQTTFTLNDGESILIKANYTVNLSGMVSINSKPGGVDFRLTGPDGWAKEATTPYSFEGLPIGQYSVTYLPPDSCGSYKPKSDKLIDKGRISFNIEIICNELNEREDNNTERSLQFVTVIVNGQNVTFEDVPMDQWFSHYVFQAAKTGIMSGHTDASGNPTGKFSPSDEVTLAQLAKIAIRLAGIDETKYRGVPQNEKAIGTWFESYYLTAEKLGWEVFFSNPNTDPSRSATRAEVVATILRALDVPRVWPKAELFTDVGFSMKYNSEIETAALDGLVDGYRDENGTPTGKFGPTNPVNRAEISKIISAAMELYIEDSPSIQAGSR